LDILVLRNARLAYNVGPNLF